jgi:predicted ester cyclase
MDDPIVVMKRFIEEFEAGGKEAVADELLAEDFADRTPLAGFGGTRDEVKRLFGVLRGAFPDLWVETVEQMTDGDRVSTRKTFHGTHQGDFFGIRPTGRKVAMRVHNIARVKEGRISEMWSVVDVGGAVAAMTRPEEPVPE